MQVIDRLITIVASYNSLTRCTSSRRFPPVSSVKAGIVLMAVSLTVYLTALTLERPVFNLIVVVKTAIIHGFGSLVLNGGLIAIVSELIDEVLHFGTLEKFAMARPNYRSIATFIFLSRSHHLAHDLVGLIVEIDVVIGSPTI